MRWFVVVLAICKFTDLNADDINLPFIKYLTSTTTLSILPIEEIRAILMA